MTTLTAIETATPVERPTTGCAHPEITDSDARTIAFAPVTWATIECTSMRCTPCRSDIYPTYSDLHDAVEFLDEPYGAGRE